MLFERLCLEPDLIVDHLLRGKVGVRPIGGIDALVLPARLKARARSHVDERLLGELIVEVPENAIAPLQTVIALDFEP